MLLSDWRALVRRWYVLLVGIVITIALCWAATIVVQARYEVTANILMLPPKSTAQDAVANPYLNLGGLEGVADVVSRTMTDRAMGETLKEKGLAMDYTMPRDPSSAGPVILVTVDGTSQKQSLATLDFLLDRLPATLSTAQTASGVGSSAMITSTVITRDEDALVIRKSQLRAVVVAAAGGLGGTFLGAALLDGLLLSRRRQTDAGRRLPLASAAGGPPMGYSALPGIRPGDRRQTVTTGSEAVPNESTADGDVPW